MEGKLLVIDGPSCVGKTSLAKSLQEQFLPSVWLNFSIDTVVYTLPAAILDECNNENNWDRVDAAALMRGAFACVDGLLKAGNNIVFDVVISSEKRARQLQQVFDGHDPFYVGVTASWERLHERASAREDRTLAEVEHGFETSPKHLPYDLLVDTTHQDSSSAAREVLEVFCSRGS